MLSDSIIALPAALKNVSLIFRIKIKGQTNVSICSIGFDFVIHITSMRTPPVPAACLTHRACCFGQLSLAPPFRVCFAVACFSFLPLGLLPPLGRRSLSRESRRADCCAAEAQGALDPCVLHVCLPVACLWPLASWTLASFGSRVSGS